MAIFKRALLAMAVAGALGARAYAETDDTGALCLPSRMVDKSLFAAKVADSFGLSQLLIQKVENARRAALAGGASASRYLQLSAPEIILADAAICPDAKASVDGADPFAAAFAACSKADAAAAQKARENFRKILIFAEEGYRFSSTDTTQLVGTGLEPAAFFLRDNPTLTCATVIAGRGGVALTNGKDSKPLSSLPVKLRGSRDGLYLDKDEGEYGSVKKATLSVAGSGVDKKRTDKIVAVIGVPLYDTTSGSPPLRTVIYAGIDRELSKVDAKAANVTSDTVDAGVVFGWRSSKTLHVYSNETELNLINWLVANPDWLYDHQTHDTIKSINFQYVPIITNWLNDTALIDDQAFKIEPLFEIHLDNGWVSGPHPATGDGPTSYGRAGPKIGVFAGSGRLPLTLTVNETWLRGWRGSPRNLDYLSADLGYALGSLFSLDLTYTNGRPEETGAREQTIGLSLGAKY